MDKNIRNFLLFLNQKRCIGGKHTPENRVTKAVLRNMRPEGIRSFDKEYKQLINEGFIIRLKKKTGKGSDWHVSLNPEKLDELKELLSFDEETENEW